MESTQESRILFYDQAQDKGYQMALPHPEEGQLANLNWCRLIPERPKKPRFPAKSAATAAFLGK